MRARQKARRKSGASSVVALAAMTLQACTRACNAPARARSYSLCARRRRPPVVVVLLLLHVLKLCKAAAVNNPCTSAILLGRHSANRLDNLATAGAVGDQLRTGSRRLPLNLMP